MAKKDFAGKNKTSKTYDKDWVFDKHQKAWVTQKQAKQAKRDRQELNEYKASQAKPNTPTASTPGTVTIPIPTTPPATGEVSTSPTNETPTTSNTSQQSAPAWWIPTAYSNPNESQSFANAANAVLPTLSPEDQRSVAKYLATNYSDVYGKYATASFAPIPTQLTTERQDYINPARAQAALNILDKVKTAAGGTPGKGYDFLKSALGMVAEYGSQGSPMTREQYAQFANAVKELSAQAGNDLSAYNNLAQMFNMPNFTAGDLVSNAPSSRLNL